MWSISPVPFTSVALPPRHTPGRTSREAVPSPRQRSHRSRAKWLETKGVPSYAETEFQLTGVSYSQEQKSLRQRLEKLQSKGKYPDSKLLSSCGTCGMLFEVEEALKAMKDAGVQVPFASNEAALQACIAQGQWEKALCLFEGFRDAVEPSRALGHVINACWRGAAWEAACEFLDLARSEALSLDSHAYAAAMRACLEPSPARSRATAAQDALAVYEDFMEESQSAGWWFWTTAARACEEGVLWEKALEILATARRSSSLAPSKLDDVRLHTLRTCAQVGQWELAVHLLDELSGATEASRLTAYCATAMACRRSACWEEATTLMEEARQLGQLTAAEDGS